jgi:hypothetical protein
MPNDLRRRFVGLLGLVTLSGVMLGVDGARRLATSISLFDFRNDIEDEQLGEIDDGSNRTLFEIQYFDRRSGCYWPIGSGLGTASTITVAERAEGRECDG